MFVYYGFIFFSLLFSFFYNKVGLLTRNYFSFLYILISILVFGSRFEVGADWYNYIRIYESYTEDLNILNKIEAGYKALNVISFLAGGGYSLVIFLSSIFFFCLTFFAVTRLKLNPYTFFALVAPYHLVMSGMNYTRQSISLSFIILTYSFLISEKKGVGALSLFLSTLFHKSAIIMGFFFFSNMKKRVVIPCSLILLSVFFITVFDEYSTRYLDSSRYDSKGFYLRYVYLLVCTYFLFLIGKYVQTTENIKKLRYIHFSFTLFIFFLSFVSTTAADRLTYYFILSGTLLLMYIINEGGRRITKLRFFMISSLFIVSFTVFIVWDSFGSISKYYQYNSIFSNLL